MEVKKLIAEVESHQVLVTIILSVLGVFCFFIKRWFFNDKDGNENKPLIRAGGDISAGGDIIAGSNTIIHHTKSEEGRNLERFEELVKNGEWRKEIIDHKEIWICESDNTFQIEQGETSREFTEEWTKGYPDPHSYRDSVYLKINGVPIKELSFISLDGGRIFVPLPEIEMENGERLFVWRRESLAFKVGRIIGDFYIYDSLEGIANRSSIRII